MKQLLLCLSMFIGTVAFAQKGLSFDVAVGTPYSIRPGEFGSVFNEYSNPQIKTRDFFGYYLGVRSNYAFSKNVSVFFEGAVERTRYADIDYSDFGNRVFVLKKDKLLLHAGVSLKFIPWLEFSIAPYVANTFSEAARLKNKDAWVELPILNSLNLHSTYMMQFIIKRWKPYVRYDRYITNFKHGLFLAMDQPGYFQFGVGYTILSKEDLK